MQNPYIGLGRQDYMNHLATMYLPDDMKLIQTAYVFSKYGHREQFRDDGERYFNHPKTVAWIICDDLEIINAKAMIVALLHDIVEDSFLLTLEIISLNFGRKVANDVLHLSNTSIKKNVSSRDARTSMYYDRLTKHGNWRAIAVKMADRIHNLRTCEVYKVSDPVKVERMIAETLHYYPALQSALNDKVPGVFRKSAERASQLLSESIATASEILKS